MIGGFIFFHPIMLESPASFPFIPSVCLFYPVCLFLHLFNFGNGAPLSTTGTILSKIVPFWYGDKPMLLKLGTAPYSLILEAIQRDGKAAAIGLAVLLTLGLGKFFGLW